MNLRVTAGHLMLSTSIITTLAGCAATPSGSSVAVMPGRGKSFATFQSDNVACKGFAGEQVKGQADAANQRQLGVGALTTVLGAGLGAAVGGITGNAGSGAAVGAATGAGGGAAIGASNSSNDQGSLQQQYDIAFSQCMYAKGEQVPGYQPAIAAGPVAVPDPMIRSTQSELIRLGYLRDTADGFEGSRTRTAIASFEQANGMPVDGASSQRLLARLQATPTDTSAANAPAPSGWVAPVGNAGTSTTAAHTAPAGWVAPTKTP